jgi:hypothetical protein
MAHIAALVAGWQRRLGGQAGPLGPVSGGSGESSAGVVQVELYVDGSWQDITEYVMVRDGGQRITIRRGRPNEGARTDPAHATMQLNNRDGRFSPRNPLSPLFGKIGRNTPIRVSVPSGNDKSYRFWGEVVVWPAGWDTTGTDVWVDLEAAGILQRLGQGSKPLGSPMFVSLAGSVPTNTVIAYWPFEDAAGSTTIGSAVSGVQAMRIFGTPTLATSNDFVCSDSLPQMGTGSFTAWVPSYTPAGAQDTTNEYNTLLRFLLEVPAAGTTDGAVIASLAWSGTIPRWEVYYSTSSGGQLGLRGLDSSGATVQDTGLGGPAMNGTKVHVTADLRLSGGIQFQYSLSILPVGSSSPTSLAGAVFGPIGGIVSVINVAPGGNLGNTIVGHVSLQLTPGLPTDATDLAAVVVAYSGETAAARLARLCGIAGIPYELVGTASDTVALGAQANAKLMDLIDQAVAADMGQLYERLNALGLGYRTRTSMENQSAALALSYAAFQLSEVPKPVDDDQYTRNDIIASRSGGSSARATLTSGPMSVLDPPAGAGRYDEAVTVNVATDAGLPDQAGWRLLLGTVDEARYPLISINLAHPSIAGATRVAALAVRPADRVTVSGLPAWLPPDDVSQLALGFAETIDQFQHRIGFNCAPERPYRTGVLGDSTLSRLDSAGSRLAQSAGPLDTTLLVATTTGQLWTTADVPFNARVSGEVVTVTAVSGASSPQSCTVTRSVNGVVKSLPTDADFRLDQPLILAL